MDQERVKETYNKLAQALMEARNRFHMVRCSGNELEKFWEHATAFDLLLAEAEKLVQEGQREAYDVEIEELPGQKPPVHAVRDDVLERGLSQSPLSEVPRKSEGGSTPVGSADLESGDSKAAQSSNR